MRSIISIMSAVSVSAPKGPTSTRRGAEPDDIDESAQEPSSTTGAFGALLGTIGRRESNPAPSAKDQPNKKLSPANANSARSAALPKQPAKPEKDPPENQSEVIKPVPPNVSREQGQQSTQQQDTTTEVNLAAAIETIASDRANFGSHQEPSSIAEFKGDGQNTGDQLPSTSAPAASSQQAYSVQPGQETPLGAQQPLDSQAAGSAQFWRPLDTNLDGASRDDGQLTAPGGADTNLNAQLVDATAISFESAARLEPAGKALTSVQEVAALLRSRSELGKSGEAEPSTESQTSAKDVGLGDIAAIVRAATTDAGSGHSNSNASPDSQKEQGTVYSGQDVNNHAAIDDSSQSSSQTFMLGINSGATQETSSASESQAPLAAHQIMSPMIEVAQSLANRQSETLRLQLQPEHFGHIDMQIMRDTDGRVSVHIATEFNGAHEALAKSIGTLRESMETAGVTVGKLDVSLGLNSGNASANGSGDHRAPGSPASNPTAKTAQVSSGDESDTGAADAKGPRLLNLEI